MRGACYPEDSFTPTKIEKITTQVPDRTPLERLFQLVRMIWPDDGQVAAIGAAAPGPLDPYQGILMNAPNIPGWIDIPLRQHLADEFQVPVGLGNDANMAALGEWKFGAGKGHHFLVYVTVSTGIGGGVIMVDNLVLGVRGLAAELGHVMIQPDGPMCGCGQPGHLEAMASGPAIARWAEDQIRNGVQSTLTAGALSAKDVALAAQKGDSLAIAALARAGKYLGWGLANYLHIFNPSIIIIGGGVSQSGRFLFDPLRAALQASIMHPRYGDGLVIARAALGDDVGLMGALAMAQDTAVNPR